MQRNSQITLTIDGNEVAVPEGTTVFDAARMNGIRIPTLCHQQNETPAGSCRLCVVEAGGRALSAACIRSCEQGLQVVTNSDRVNAIRRTIIELLASDHSNPCVRQQNSGDCEVESWADLYQIRKPRFPQRRKARPVDDSSLSILVDHGACILCDRCIRGCAEIRNNNVIARQGKGYETSIAFDMSDPMGASSCVSCGECMVSCPTGALTNKKRIDQQFGGESASAKELLEMPVFQGVSGTFLELNRGAIRKRRIPKGEIIFREGETGSTAFYIVEGTVDIFISSPRAHVATEDAQEGWFQRLRNKLVNRGEDRREGENLTSQFISIDAPVDLAYDNPIAQLGPHDLFGEMTCMSFYPRSATARATEDCVVFEMLRNVLDVLQKNKTFRAHLDVQYRARALENQLRSVPIFSSLTPEFIDELRTRVTLERYAAGKVIFQQGDAADAFYVVRLGFVKVSENYPGGEIILSYLGKGGYFGEIGLLGEGLRTATCTALDHVEVIRIGSEEFVAMVSRFPEIAAQLRSTAEKRLRENRERSTQLTSVPIDQFLTQGLMEAQSLLVLDLDRCTRCDQCVKACADSHDGVTRLIRDGLRFDRFLIATSCRQCRDPLCMVGCPVGAIRRKGSLEVIIEDWCIGCGVCASNCPYGNINLQEFEVQSPMPALPATNEAQPTVKKAVVVRKATSCNLCYDLPEPSCVYACPHDAAHRVNPSEFFAGILGRTERD